MIIRHKGGAYNIPESKGKIIKMSKLKEKIERALENIYWVNSEGNFKIVSEYPQDFEQKFGNISFNTLFFEEYLIDCNRISDFHDFLKKWDFDVTQQYKINEYTSGTYFCDDFKIMIKAKFGKPDNKVEKDDDGEYPMGDSNGDVMIQFAPILKNKEIVEKFIREFLNEDFLFLPMEEKSFYMVASGSHGLYKKKTTFKNIEIKDDRYDLYYGSAFPHEKITKFFDEDSENLMILYGIPGSGKTNYIKNLIVNCDRDVIYVPPSMVSIISDPGFVSFMLQNQGNVLIIEDAEQILSQERNSATQNILGLSDGFLKDSLKLKIICTMNADIKTIDPALLRKGRLYLSHHFDKLSVVDANKLAKYCGIDHVFDEDITLCDIFNLDAFESPLKKQERSIGFLS